eukprot:jgi/Botrbrau1/7979/Bobra.384_2s0007.1
MEVAWQTSTDGRPSARADFVFPQYVGHRRPLRVDAELFLPSNSARNFAAGAISLEVNGEEEARLLHTIASSAQADQVARSLAGPLYFCAECGAQLASNHLLGIHVAEAHDSFFAAQAARCQKVFQCLVEGCVRMFMSAPDRRRHLLDFHGFPPDYDFRALYQPSRNPRMRQPRLHPAGSGKTKPLPSQGSHGGLAGDRAPALPSCAACCDEPQAMASMPGGSVGEGRTAAENAVAVEQGHLEDLGDTVNEPGMPPELMEPSRGGNADSSLRDPMAIDGLGAQIADLRVSVEPGAVPASVRFGRRGRGLYRMPARGGRRRGQMIL